MRSATKTNDLPIEYVKHLRRQGFKLVGILGQGLSGSVYLAEQPSLNRKVAVKFFDSAFVRTEQAMQKRFIREAKLLACFQHPNIPYVLTEGVVDVDYGHAPYFVMEYVNGTTLQALIREKGKIDLSLAIDVALQVLDALGYAHSNQIVHRDVKPSNVMIDGRLRCFLIDFSIGVSFENNPGLTRATMQGEFLGTPPYSSPEQMTDASSVDSRTDIYSVGVMLAEMLSGRPELTNIGRTLSSFPRNLVDAIEKACAPDVSLRHKTAEDFIRAIGGRHNSPPPTLAPALAICTNNKCSDANWSPRGYYRGPRFVSESTKLYCTSCGNPLKYLCHNCGGTISETPFCGGCGAEIFTIPECKKCGSLLTKEHMDTKGEFGCSKCKSVASLPPLRPSRTTKDDDIPF